MEGYFVKKTDKPGKKDNNISAKFDTLEDAEENAKSRSLKNPNDYFLVYALEEEKDNKLIQMGESPYVRIKFGYYKNGNISD